MMDRFDMSGNLEPGIHKAWWKEFKKPTSILGLFQTDRGRKGIVRSGWMV